MFRWLKKLVSGRPMVSAAPSDGVSLLFSRVPTMHRPAPQSTPGLRVVGPRRAAAGRAEPIPYDCIPSVDYPSMPRAFSARDDWPTFVSPSAELVSSGGGGDFAGAGATSSWSDTSSNEV